MSAPLVIDARGLKCPLPVLRCEKALAGMAGTVALEVLADDPVARIDIPLLAQKRGLVCEMEESAGSGLRFVLRNGE
ncbi:MAG: sulfurtransferase TusA family protein [Alphaproteobacteria bacterium]|nr:sulfurtransferase TusA family protein [Alphaproteobacteria bacterium]